MLERGETKDGVNAGVEKLFRAWAAVRADVIVAKAHLANRRMVLLPCLLISGVVFAGDVRTVSFDGDGKVWKCTQEQVVLGAAVVSDKGHLADGVGKGSAKVRDCNEALLFCDELDGEVVSNETTNKSTEQDSGYFNWDLHRWFLFLFHTLIGCLLGADVLIAFLCVVDRDVREFIVGLSNV